MFRFISFGSGSSGNCYYVCNDQGGLFIDVGIGFNMLKKYFSAYNLQATDTKAILVTHDHADHVRSVGSVSHEFTLPVYATETVHKYIDRNYVVRHKVNIAMRRYIKIGEPFAIAGMNISTIPIPHDSSENVGYRIEYKGVVFALVTDVGHVTSEIAALIADANYLVFESNHELEMLKNGRYPQYLKERILSDMGHLSNADCGAALRDYATDKLKHVWLCHLSNDNNDPELARYTVEAILRDGGRQSKKNFLLDVLKRKTPSDIFEME